MQAETPARLTRADLESARIDILSDGRFGNACLHLCRDRDGNRWVIKDFRPRPWIVRATFGAFAIRREILALSRFQGVAGLPRDAYQLDRYAVAYRFMPGKTLRDCRPAETPPAFFEAFERMVRQMHARGVAHLDLRYRRNVLVQDDGNPGLIDFQSHVRIHNLPRWLQDILKRSDLSGVYKHWAQRQPESLGAARANMLIRQNGRRTFWILKGYGFRLRRRRRYEHCIMDTYGRSHTV